jgi:ankyrin repeat protein
METNNEALSLALIEAGAPLDDGGAICRAAAKSATILRALMQREVDFSQLRDGEGRTPCHLIALRHDSTDVVDTLRTLVHNAGVHIDAQDNNGFTCAFYCTAFRRPMLLRWLVDAGANLDLVDSRGETALHASLRTEFNVNSSDKHRCLLLLLAGGIDLHVKDASGRTACHVAASGVAESVVPLEMLHELLAAGADFDASDNDGGTPRQICAARNRSMPTVRDIERATRRIVAVQLEMVRARALQVCIGLQPLGLDALRTCEILRHACGPVAPLVPFHCWWQIATAVKHFRQHS